VKYAAIISGRRRVVMLYAWESRSESGSHCKIHAHMF
jgi:hypothetical protein